jgi:hypothetical protein
VVDAVPGELPLLAPFLEQAGDAVTLLSGRPTSSATRPLLQRLEVLVTPNTGPMHFAAAVGTKVVALFSGWKASECGPFVPAERTRIVRAEDMPGGERGLAGDPAGGGAASAPRAPLESTKGRPLSEAAPRLLRPARDYSATTTGLTRVLSPWTSFTK